MDELLFPAVTFQRVFDTEPRPEVLGLPDLLAALRRFEVKTETQAKVDRELARVARARAAVLAGEQADGPVALRLHKARAEGGDAAVIAQAGKLEDDIRRDAKKDLRLWSPVLYRPGAKRGTEGVAALGCVVLDYDAGLAPEEASEAWEGSFHVLHTTWSHTPARPRFRVVVPLARLVDAADWPAVWAWAADRAGGPVDPALKGAGATFALPALSAPDAPRLAWVRAGPLLDPESEGLPLRPVATRLARSDTAGSAMLRRDLNHTFVDVGEQ